MAPDWLMSVIRLVIVLVVGGVAGLIAVPLLPQQAQDWVSSWQRRATGVVERENGTYPEPTPALHPTPTPRATPTRGFSPIPTPAPTPTPRSIATRGFTPVPTLVPTSTPRSIATRGFTPVPTLAPTSTPSVISNSETTQELRLYMLDLINRDRLAYGLTPVELGSNSAAQGHAEELFRNGFLGHWGLDGLKPYMRYTSAGGTGAEGENVHGTNNLRVPGARYATTPVRDSLRQAQEGLMTSPDHRRNILYPSHQKVNLGIACDNVGCTVVQQFESNYVYFDRVPSIENGRLVFSGQMLGGFVYESAHVWFDPLLRPLQAAQIRGTYCYDLGIPIAFIIEPAPPGTSYPTDSAEYSWPNCLDPGDVDPAAPPPQITGALPDHQGQVPWETATEYRAQGELFAVQLNIAEYLAQYGDGVYTVIIWGERDEASTALTNYSIFVKSP